MYSDCFFWGWNGTYLAPFLPRCDFSFAISSSKFLLRFYNNCSILNIFYYLIFDLWNFGHLSFQGFFCGFVYAYIHPNETFFPGQRRRRRWSEPGAFLENQQTLWVIPRLGWHARGGIHAKRRGVQFGRKAPKQGAIYKALKTSKVSQSVSRLGWEFKNPIQAGNPIPGFFSMKGSNVLWSPKQKNSWSVDFLLFKKIHEY